MNLDIDDITLRVYCARMDEDSGKGAAERQLLKDNDGGAKMKRRSTFYRPIVIETLIQAGIYVRPINMPPRHVKKMEEA